MITEISHCIFLLLYFKKLIPKIRFYPFNTQIIAKHHEIEILPVFCAYNLHFPGKHSMGIFCSIPIRRIKNIYLDLDNE